MSDDLSGTDYIRALAARQPEAQEAFVRHFHGRVRRVARSLCPTDADAEDVTQQVLIDALRDVGKFRQEGTLQSWVDRITIRRALQVGKLAQVRSQLLARYRLPGTLPWGTNLTVVPNGAEDVDALLAVLNPERRSVLILHHGLGYSVREIAEMLGVPRGTVKDRLVAGKKHLRRLSRRDDLRADSWTHQRRSVG